METIADLMLIAGAIAWWTTTIVHTNGPGNIFFHFRNIMSRLLQGHTPLTCNHCTSFWVGLVILSFFVSGDVLSMALVQFFGVLGIAQYLRGGSGIF